jgi:hypothetical protein
MERFNNQDLVRIYNPIAVLLLAPAILLAQDPAGPTQQKPRIFSILWWLGLADDKPATINVAPDASRIWREDNVREEIKHRTFWNEFRQREQARIGSIIRAETQTALLTAQRRGEAASAEQRRQDKPRSGSLVSSSAEGSEVDPASGERGDPGSEGSSIKDRASAIANKLGNGVADAGRKIGHTATKVAEALEESLRGKVSATGPKTASVLLSLLAILLIPALGAALLGLAWLSLKEGHRLQASVFAAMGCTVGVLLLSAWSEKANNGADGGRMREEMRAEAATITAVVEYSAEEGMVLSSVNCKKGRSPAKDSEGCILLVTDDAGNLRGGSPVKMDVFPMGSTRIPNALGAMNNVPTYTDSLEKAVDHHWRVQQEQNKWWWQRFSRFLLAKN